MIDYKTMYQILCTAASKALDLLPENDGNRLGRAVLQEALPKAEEVYVNQGASGA